MFANIWMYWKLKLLHHVNMKCNIKFIDYHLSIYWLAFVLYFNPTILHNL